MTHKQAVYDWMDRNYTGQFRTIRAVWYSMKPYIQECNTLGYRRGGDLGDKSATTLIGKYLWDEFCNGNINAYGNIGNSARVNVGELPVILFTEKNTLSPFGDLAEHTTSFEYSASGQTNSYEIANIILALLNTGVEDIYIYGVTDYDKSGDEIYDTIISKFKKFFNVHHKQFHCDWLSYETYTQPNGEIGVELDAITNLPNLVYDDLSDFLPSHLFEGLSIDYKKQEVYMDEISNDEDYKRILDEKATLEKDTLNRISRYTYTYNFSQNHLCDLVMRTEVTI